MNNRLVLLIGLLMTFSTGQLLAQPPQPGGNPAQPLGDAPVPAENPITESKRVLGKILFWDEQLSSDNSIACGTCHKPADGGGDNRLGTNPGFDQLFGTADDVVGSQGIRALDENGMQLNDPIFGHAAQVTGRGTPSFLTSMFADTNFWDGRATDQFVDPENPNTIIIASGGALESQAVGPILSTVEMAQQGRGWSDVISKLSQVTPLSLATNVPADMADALQSVTSYGQLFQSAFGDNEITAARIGMAIATYERTLVPNQTPWDRFVAGDSNAMTASQIAGWNDFTQETPCGNCHRPPLFSDDNFRNIGLRPSIEDFGRFDVTGNNRDRGEFRTPSLRNTGLRKSLMHVGTITSVADAIDFYNAGTNNNGHVQFTADQSGIPNTNVDIDEINVFGDDAVRRGQIVDFIANGLTDPRVAAESFPFDRPTLASEVQTNTPVTPTDPEPEPEPETDPDTTEGEAAASAIAGVTSNASATTASFNGTVSSNTGPNNRNRFNRQEVLSVNMQINVASEDAASTGNIYSLIRYNGTFYALNENGSYVLWNSNTPVPVARRVPSLGMIQQVAVLDRLTQLGGEFAVFVGYDAEDGVIRYNSTAIQFIVD
ncbi:MAG: cytochrome-c peroxidase [Pseudohongiellaceae bacterium]